MQTRLLACLAGALLGVALTSTVSNTFGISPTVALIGCAFLGLGLGYAISSFFDVFSASGEDQTVETPDHLPEPQKLTGSGVGGDGRARARMADRH